MLSEEIAHHVKEEEMRVEGLFSQAREAGLDMDALGEAMRDRKAELLARFEASGLPVQQVHALKGARVQHVGLTA